MLDTAARTNSDGAGAAGRPVVIWDLPIRLFHWLAALLVAAAYVTWRLDWMDWHAWVGEALLALVLFRLLWGLWGSETARFSCFLKSPSRAVRHLSRLLRPEPDTASGHNPAGGWMVLVLLLLLLFQSLTGIYVNNDIADQGPLTDLSPPAVANLIDDLHDRLLWDALLAAIALHLLAILVYFLAKRQDLVVPMITGRKNLPSGTAAPRLASPTRALVLLAGAAAAAAALAYWL